MNNNNQQYKKNENELGVLWEKTSAKGGRYFSGVLELAETGKINIVIFSNLNRKSEKAPTHIILKSNFEKPKTEKAEELPEINEDLPF